jgi:hypothetical protein
MSLPAFTGQALWSFDFLYIASSNNLEVGKRKEGLPETIFRQAQVLK